MESSTGGDFLTETITPIEGTHRAALKAGLHWRQLNQTLDRRTLQLAATNRSLKLGIARRKAVECALRKSGEHSRRLLKEARQLQKHLQH